MANTSRLTLVSARWIKKVGIFRPAGKGGGQTQRMTHLSSTNDWKPKKFKRRSADRQAANVSRGGSTRAVSLQFLYTWLSHTTPRHATPERETTVCLSVFKAGLTDEPRGTFPLTRGHPSRDLYRFAKQRRTLLR